MRKTLLLVLTVSFISFKSLAQCNPGFTYTLSNSTVYVQATNTAPNVVHFWHFEGPAQWGGGGASLSYTYSAPGTYIITHQVTDTVNYCNDSTQQTITINSVAVCHSGFVITQSAAHYDEYSFTSTSGTNTGTINYSWIVNGTEMAQTQNLTHTFAHGTSNVCLMITTSAGCSASSCQAVTVFDTAICNWSASFVATALPTNPRQVSFVPAPSSDQMRYSWNFGDGHTSTLQIPTYTYAQAGTYQVRLAILDTITGCRDTVIHQLQVTGLPSDSCTVLYSATADSAHPNQIHFTAISNQTITSQIWRIYHWVNPFYDTIVITANNPTYTFMDTGYYYTCLFITTNTGCSNWFCWGLYIDELGDRQAGRIPSYPNPARSSVSFRLNLSEDSRISVAVYNLSGYAVYRAEKNGNRGSNEITIPVQQLNSGQYFIDIQYGNQRKRSIFQKL